MEFRVDGRVLLGALDRAMGVVDKATTINALSHVRIESHGDGIRLTATNYDVFVITEIKANVVDPGDVALSCKMLHSAVKVLRDGEIRIRVGEDHNGIVTGGKSRFKVPGITADDALAAKIPTAIKTIELPRDVFARAIARVSLSMSHDETRPALNGALLRVAVGAEKRLQMVSTDGHRLAFSNEPVDVEIDEPFDAVIHRKGIGELQRLMDGHDKPVTIAFNQDETVTISADGTSMIIRRAGDACGYPEFDRVIPSIVSHQVVFKVSDLTESLKRVVPFVGRLGVVRIKFVEGSTVTITARTNDGDGEAEDTLYLVDDGGTTGKDGMVLGLSSKYINDVLVNIKTPNVKVGFSDTGSPILFSEDGDDDCRYVIMPMKL